MPAWAQDDGDAPEAGVARISLINGDVSVRRGDTGELVAAEVNAPLVERDHLLTAEGSRAEVQFDYANMIRVGPASEVRLGELRDLDYLVQVAEGLTTFRVLRDSSALVEVSTPTVSVRPIERGVYRVLVRPDGSTQVTVRGGRAEIFTPRGTEILRSGQTMEVRGDPANPDFMISSAIPSDQWDRWNELRDNDLQRSQSYQYVSRDISGADDLDRYGRWVYDSPYGWVWVPSVAPGWAPYRVGRWVNINYYGWTWLSGDPWGWAPYHYGRWYYGPSFGWAWYPGAFGPRYYWRPALVSFFGWGSAGFGVNVGFGFGFGNVGWVPLAPYEIYRPWYGRGFRNTTIINNNVVVNNINIVNNYRNARFVNGQSGVTSVAVNSFGRNRVTVNNYVRAGTGDLNRTGEVRGRLPVDATPESRRFNDRQANPQTVARAERRGGGDPQFMTRGDRSGSDRSGGGRGAPGTVAAGPDAGRGSNRTPVANDAARTAGRGRIAGAETEADRAARSGIAPANSRAAAAGANEANNGDTNTGWRRFAEPARADQPRTDAAARSTRRTEPAARTDARSTSTPATAAPANGWRRFDADGTTSRSAGTTSGGESPAGFVTRPSNGSSGSGSSGSPSTRGSRSSDSPASAPSGVVRSQRGAQEMPSRIDRSDTPRSAPSTNAPSQSPSTVSPSRSRSSSRVDQRPSRGDFGSSTPFVQAPRSAPAPSPSSGARSAPRSSTPSGGGVVRSAPRSSPASPPATRSAPRSSAPSAPRVTAPSAPRVSAPRASAPSAPRVNAPRASAPSAPRVSAPRAPSAPSGGGGGGGVVRSGGGNAPAGGGGARGRR